MEVEEEGGLVVLRAEAAAAGAEPPGPGAGPGPGRLVLPWRPLLAALWGSSGSPPPAMTGAGLRAARGLALARLAGKARRHFAPAGLLELWAALRPAVEGVARRPSDAYEAASLLSLFAPTHGLHTCGRAAPKGRDVGGMREG